MRRLPIALVLLIMTCMLTVSRVAGQERPSQPPTGGGVTPNALPCPDCGPWGSPEIVLLAPSPLTVTTQYPYIEIDWCDPDGALAGATRVITMNSVNQTGAFTYEQVAGGNCGGGEGDHRKSATTSVPLNMGTNTLTARICDDENNCNELWWQLERVNPPITPAGPVIARELCLTIAVGRGAAYECGDLRIVHTLPSVRTLGQVRTPTLLYNSQHAHPYVSLNADLTFARFASRPDSVFAIARVNSGTGFSQRDRRAWAGSQWGPLSQAVTRRVMTNWLAEDLATGLYPFQLELVAWTVAGGPSTIRVDTGTVVIVNRRGSPFGAGWWLAGLE